MKKDIQYTSTNLLMTLILTLAKILRFWKLGYIQTFIFVTQVFEKSSSIVILTFLVIFPTVSQPLHWMFTMVKHQNFSNTFVNQLNT